MLDKYLLIWTFFFSLHVYPGSCYFSAHVVWLFRPSLTVAERADHDLCDPPQDRRSWWLFGLLFCRPVDRSSSTVLQASLLLLGQAETLKASCWDSADRHLLWGADIIRAESRFQLFSSLSEGKRKSKKEQGIEGGRMEAGLSNARSRSWHNYPGNAVPWEAEAPDFSPCRGHLGCSSRQLASQ